MTLQEKNLPPKIPKELELLDRAITLLGNRTKNPLKSKPTEELQNLISATPNEKKAAIWKKELRRIRKLRIADNFYT